MKIIICDDNKSICNALKSQILSIDNTIEVIVFSSWFSLCEYIENNSDIIIDAIFMDIEFPNTSKNGIDFANEIIQYIPNLKIIFVSGYTEKYLEDIYISNYRLKPFGIIKKPVDIQKLRIYIQQIAQSNKIDNTKYLKFKAIHSGLVYIDINDILYINSQGRYVNINTKNGVYTGYYKLLDIFDILKELSNRFYNCHKSYIININAISNIPYNCNYIVINNENIPLSRINGTSIGEKKKEIIKLKAVSKTL